MSNYYKGSLGTSVTKESTLNSDKFKRIKNKFKSSCADCGSVCEADSYVKYFYELKLVTHVKCQNPMKEC